MTRTAIALLAILLATPTLRADPERLKDAALVLTEMAGMGDKGIPTSLIAKAQCVVIIPSLKKAAFVVGAQYGRGYMSCRKKRAAGAAQPACAWKVEASAFRSADPPPMSSCSS